MHMIFFVLDDPDLLVPVLDAWEKAGVCGATIVDSTGMQRMKKKYLPMRFAAPFYTDEETHLTLTAIVREEALVEAACRAAESVVGDLKQPRTGIFAAWPLSYCKGLDKEARN